MIEALVGVLVGALLAAAFQWVITPRVERGIRAEQRWEEDLLALHLLLNDEVPAAIEALKTALGFKELVKNKVEPGEWSRSDPAVIGLSRQADRDFFDASTQWSALVHGRLAWLCARAIGRGNMTFLRYHLEAYMMPSIYVDIDSMTGDEIEVRWEVERECRKALIDEVTTRADGLVRPSKKLSRFRKSGTGGSST